MYYSKIHGHFNFEFLYADMVNKFDSGSVFVEIGAYLGKSTCFLAEKIIASGKDIELNVIDNWIGHPLDVNLAKEIDRFGDIFIIFNDNMKKAGVFDRLNIIRGDSADSADLFKDNSIDFVFIDAAHDYESVKRDVNAWLPKVKTTGVLAGHDYVKVGRPTTSKVRVVVDEMFGSKIKVVENIWVHYKNKEI